MGTTDVFILSYRVAALVETEGDDNARVIPVRKRLSTETDWRFPDDLLCFALMLVMREEGALGSVAGGRL